MNDPTFVPPSASPNRNPLRFALGCTVVALVLMALIAFGALRLFRSGQTAVQDSGAVAGKFLDAVQAHRYADARALMTPDVQAKTPVASLRDLQQLLEKRHGAPNGRGPAADWNINSFNGVTSVRLVMAQKFQKGDVPATLTLQNTPDGWRVLVYHFSL